MSTVRRSNSIPTRDRQGGRQTGRSPRNGPWRERLAGFAVAFAALLAGCTRGYYRVQTDQEVTAIIEQDSNLSLDPLKRFSIQYDPRSRMFDPYDPDRPPMPPDDPNSHQLMKCVDGKRGYLKWYRNGFADSVEDFDWQSYMPVDEAGAIVLDRDGAVELARVNSREYQLQLETLYLSAMDVSFERFRFDAQFFGGNTTNFTADGPDRSGLGPQSVLSTVNDLQRTKLWTGGGEFLVGIANSFVWQFAGPNSESANTLLNFNLLQPLLRGGGRAVVMERLTLAERNLLANIRLMEQYRRGFYATIVTGRNASQGPTRRGGVFGGAGLSGFTGVGSSGFGQVGSAVGGGGGIGGGGFAGGAGAPEAGGFFGLLQDLQSIRNLEANVAGLRDSLAQLEASYDAGRIDRFQVDLTRQALYQAESRLLIARASFEQTLDGFKVTMGLPPDLRFQLRDPFLERFNLVDPHLTDIQERSTALLAEVRNPLGAGGLDQLKGYLDRAEALRADVDDHIEIVREDFATLEQNLPGRRENLRRLAGRRDSQAGSNIEGAFDVETLNNRVKQATEDFAELQKQIAASWSELDQLVETAQGGADADATRIKSIEVLRGISDQLLALSLVQARARLDAVDLETVNLRPGEALEIARENRLDWMNARAAVIDAWRLIEFNANGLLSGLNVVFSGDLGTTGDNPINFRSTTGRLRVGVEFDAPLTRLAERNFYRESLISYQQARRSYMQFEDRIHQLLRSELRQVYLNQLNFELNRAAVDVAINKVELARLKLSQPPKPGETSTFGDSFARDLVTALADLLDAQNAFISVWVNYQVQRISIDFDLGTMQLDDRGLWIDPGAIGSVDPTAEDDDATEELLPPEVDGLEVEDETDPSDLPREPARPKPVPAAEELPEPVISSRHDEAVRQASAVDEPVARFRLTIDEQRLDDQ